MKLSLLSPVAVSVALLGCAMSPAFSEPETVSTKVQPIETYPVSVEPGDLATPPDGQLLFIVSVEPRWDEATGQTVFDAQDWMERMDRPVFAGGTTRVSVASERFPTCGLGGRITMGLRYDNGVGRQVELTGRQQSYVAFGDIHPPVGAHEVQLWFHAQGPDGCEEWDSDFGNNYRIPVYAWEPTVVHFHSDWTEVADGPIHAGGALVVEYDEARLPTCRGTYHGYPSWDIFAWMSADGAQPMRQSVRQFTYQGPHGTPTGEYHMKWAVFPVPYDAHRVSLWFENEQYPPTCHGWDSNFGSNYVFDLQR